MRLLHVKAFLLSLLFFQLAYSQRTVSGKVTTPEGQALEGVSIYQQKTNNGVITNAQGVYTIELKATAANAIEVSFIGYNTQVITNPSSQQNISLIRKDNSLQEVLVVGYVTQKKADLTGAVSVVTAKDIANIPVGEVSQVLQGKAAGVAVTSTTGAPGEAIAVRIRGVGTINNNDPLYIIDGVPTKDGLNILSPADIESVNILKDAASAAIYGARASNGVVIITTKKGKTGKGRVSLNLYGGSQQPANLIKMADAEQYVKAYNTAAVNDGRATIPENISSTFTNTNWLKEVLKPAPIYNAQLSVSGGSDNSNYILSANYFKQDGMILHSSFERANVRTGINSKVSNFLSIGTNINLSYSKNRQVGNSGDGYGAGNPGASVIRYALFATPTYPVRNEDGQYVDLPPYPQYQGEAINPVEFAEFYDKTYNSYELLGDIYLELSPIKNLKLRTDAGTNFIMTDFRQFNKTFGIDRSFGAPGSLGESHQKNFYYNWTNTANYSFELGKGHAFNLLAGSEFIKNSSTGLSASRIDYPNQAPNFQYLDNGLGIQQNGGNESRWALFSLFGRAAYQYNDKYLASFNYRHDGSSRLSPGSKYGDFYGGSIGWVISKEKFMPNIPKLSLLKLRAGIGQLGNQEIGNYPYTSVISSVGNYPLGGVSQQGNSIVYKGNPDIKWETSTQVDGGLDIGFFENSLQLTADYFVKNTSNVLLSIPEPSSAGSAGSPTVNAGKIKNTGLELELRYTKNIKKDLSYSVTGNFATVQNKVVSLAGGAPIIGARVDNGFYATLTEVGHPIGSFYLLQQEGIFQNQKDVITHAYQGPGIQPGDVKFKDISGPKGVPDGVIDDYDRSIVGSPIPKFTYGFTGTVNYKNFDLVLFFQGVEGNKLYYQALNDIEGFYRPFNVTERIATKSWTGEGTSNKYPRLSWTGSSNNRRPSTRNIEDGSYLRLKNVQLGYSLGSRLLAKASISSIRVYISAQNLLTFTKYSGLDPEMYTNNNSAGEGVRAVGIDWGNYPSARTITAGLNVNF